MTERPVSDYGLVWAELPQVDEARRALLDEAEAALQSAEALQHALAEQQLYILHLEPAWLQCSQPTVDDALVEELALSHGPCMPALALEVWPETWPDGEVAPWKIHLLDGHHRAAAAACRGDDVAVACVIVK